MYLYIFECIKFLFKNFLAFSHLLHPHKYDTRITNLNISFHMLFLTDPGFMYVSVCFYNKLLILQRISEYYNDITKLVNFHCAKITYVRNFLHLVGSHNVFWNFYLFTEISPRSYFFIMVKIYCHINLIESVQKKKILKFLIFCVDGIYQDQNVMLIRFGELSVERRREVQSVNVLSNKIDNPYLLSEIYLHIFTMTWIQEPSNV